MLRLLLSVILLVSLTGCAEIEPPGPERILAPWSGVPHVRLGESKDSVRDKWGEPDEIRQLGTDNVGLVREEWVYRARYDVIPVDYQNLSKTKKLRFTGNSITGYDTGQESGIQEGEPE